MEAPPLDISFEGQGSARQAQDLVLLNQSRADEGMASGVQFTFTGGEF
jgi:Tfp pilus assembly ATPase PilU